MEALAPPSAASVFHEDIYDRVDVIGIAEGHRQRGIRATSPNFN